MSKVFVLIAAIILLSPMWFTAVGSFQDLQGVMSMPPRPWPRIPTLENYAWVMNHPIALWARNTGIIVILTVVISVTVCCCAAYAFAFYDFKFKKVLWLLLLAGVMVPRISLIIPLFVVLRKVGLGGTLVGIVMKGAVAPTALYLARAFFETVPKSLLDAARIDGAGDVTILARVVAPISKPIITCLALFAAMGAQGDYVWQNLQLQRPEVVPLLVGLMRAVNDRQGGQAELMMNPIGRKLAMAMVLLLPMLLIYFTASRYFTSALGGAIKE